MLTGTPYLLEGSAAEGVAAELQKVAEQVSTFRKRGALDDKTLDRLRKEWRVEQVYETTGIEGNTLDLQETRLVIERGVTISGKPSRDSDDALRMQQALDYLETLAREDSALSARDIREIQSLVVGDSVPDRGTFRTGDVRISQSEHTPPPGADVPQLVDEAIEWLAAHPACPPVLAATVMHAWLTHIHPFTDGNGRTARAVMNLILIRAGYPIVLIRRKDRTRYYDALAASDEADIAPLLDLIIKRCQDSLRQILRVRAEATGLTEALQRAEDRMRTQYETWHQAMLLLLRSIEEAAEDVEQHSSGNVRIRLREYDQVTLDDYRALLNRDKTGNGWLAALRGHGYTKQSELLLWNGFRSPKLAHLSGRGERGGSVFVSEPDPTRSHGPFKPLADDAAFDIREIAFDDGTYWVLVKDVNGVRCKKMRVNELAMHLSKEFIAHYLS